VGHKIFDLAAQYVDKILRGTNPAEMPVQQPTKFELVVNERTATALGLRFRHCFLFGPPK
jgi:putative ABC transport system substrate-binding protein